MLLEIADTGIGIEEAYQGDVFEEFMQIDNDHRSIQNGLGLGLAIVSRLSALCDIPVAMASKPGQGTRFTLTLPAAAMGSTTTDSPAATTRQPYDDVTILLVDDDKAVTEALSSLLESLGATVSAHQSLASALTAMETAVDAPSLLITDQQIGPGTNATTVIDAATRHFGQTIPALVITGNTAPDFLSQLPDNVDVLFKPVGVDALTRKFSEMLVRPGVAQGASE